MVRTVLTIALLVSAVTVSAAAAAPRPTEAERTCRGLVATIVGTQGDDRLTGTRGPDVIVGLGGNDTILGLAGDDVLCGNGGADRLVGGRGADLLHGGRDQRVERPRRTILTGDVLEGGPGKDHLSVGYVEAPGRVRVRRHNTVSYQRSSRPVTVDLATGVAHGEGADTVVRGRHLEVRGSRHDDLLQGSGRPEILDGGPGNDQVLGGGGADVVVDRRGDDVLDGESGDDLVISTAGVDTVGGGDGADLVVAAGRETSTLSGGAGDDYLARSLGEDETGVIDGGPGNDQLELAPQLWWDRDPSAALDAEAGTAVVTAGSDTRTTTFTGVRYFTLWGLDWTFRGSAGDDFVQVLEGALDAEGLGGDDYLIGSEYDDVLDGGEGTDTAWGGEGRNTCVAVEAGRCSGYPWDTGQARARVIAHDSRLLVDTAPRLLVTRWLEQRPGRTTR